MKNVLVFPCGSEIGLEIYRALKGSIHFKVFGASSIDDHGRYVYENYIGGVPLVEEPGFIDSINLIIKKFNIDFIIPAHDSAVLKMAESQHLLAAEVITSTAETCAICRSKSKTYEVFNGLLNVPQIYSLDHDIGFPAFMKPDVGQGSKGTYKANTKDEVDFYFRLDPTLLLLEYLPGKEYTIDCFTDKSGKLLFSEGRQRARIYSGISVNSKPVKDGRFLEIAEIINRTLKLQGAWFFQVKERVNGELVLMEIAPRIAGTMGLFRVAGVNFIQLSLFDRMGGDVEVLRNDFDLEVDRALSSRFFIRYDYSVVYIDFDDTIIVNGIVNTNLLKFLYQARNQKKKIILISKHKLVMKESLSRYAISEALFDQIIIVDERDEKNLFINQANAIFIDDSFSERKRVHEKLGIPVFSIDAIEALLSD